MISQAVFRSSGDYLRLQFRVVYNEVACRTCPMLDPDGNLNNITSKVEDRSRRPHS